MPRVERYTVLVEDSRIEVGLLGVDVLFDEIEIQECVAIQVVQETYEN